MIVLDDFETVNLAADLMIPTEVKEVPPPKPEEKTSAASPEAVSNKTNSSEEGVNLSDVITPEDSAEYLVTGIDSILGLIGGAFYAIKGSQILKPEEKKILQEVRKKTPSQRTPEEQHLIDYFEAEKLKLEEKSEAVDLNEKEIVKLKKTSKAFVKMKNIKIGPEIAFYVTLVDVISDRIIDAFVD